MKQSSIQELRDRIWRWLQNQLVQDVPEASGLCEYDCRKLQCTEEEWAACERRMKRAAGELWPGPRPSNGEAPELDTKPR